MVAPFPPDSRLVERVRPSPNFGARAAGKAVDMVLLHYTGMPARPGLAMAERAMRWLEDPRSEVSAHYVVDEDGGITQMVAEANRAWHAGKAFWQGETDINSVSIGIEIAHPGHAFDPATLPDAAAGAAAAHPGYGPFPPAQVGATLALVADIVRRRHLDPGRVLAHSDVAPERKLDPGELFPWADFSRHGLGFWVPPAPLADDSAPVADADADAAVVQALLASVGFRIAVTSTFDETTLRAITAFQRHWRPERVDGRADASTIATLRRLAAAMSGQSGEA